MPKKCFVIMPFGSISPEQKRIFDGVYSGIIVPAVCEAGYEPLRADFCAKPGSIPKDIIIKLAKAEMVIADLTNINPNVFYELGIRHVFSKSGTVLIMNQEGTIPFDNASYRVIQYTNELADLDDIRNQIVEAIKSREDNPNYSDNIVHDTYSSLPKNTMSFFSKKSKNDQIIKLQEQVKKLSDEKEKLTKICKDNGISIKGTPDIPVKSVKELISDARLALEKSGRFVMLQLQQFAEQDDINGFVDCLEGALEAGYMSESDYVHVYKICKQLGLLPLQLAVMERAFTLFPESESIITYLSDVYTQMPLRETKLKGVSTIEKLLGIHNINGKYIISSPTKYINENTLMTLFNAYIRLDLYDRTISVCESCEQLNLPFTSLVMRNKAGAFASLRQYDDAKKTYLQLLEIDYYDDSNHAFYSSFLDDIGDYIGCYKEHEIAAILDPNDANRFITLAINIINNHYVHTGENQIVKIKKADETIQYVMPLFMYAIKIEDTKENRTNIANILFRQKHPSYAQAIMNHQQIDDSKFSTYPLEYILSANIDEIQSENNSKETSC